MQNNLELVLIILSSLEVILLLMVLIFFLKLKKSEKFIAQLQKNQEHFLQKLSFSSKLEQEILETFNTRQKELFQLEEVLSQKTKELKKLISKAEQFTNSPAFAKQVIILGYKAGESIDSLAKTFNLTREEVELIIENAK
ncbi:MAG: hypothetical protein Q9M37_09060 [Desulfonauticus sp.]|nr:hypothetical protein [Desulfonauticus sp.]